MESADTVAIATWKGTERGRLIGEGDGGGEGEGDGDGEGDEEGDGEGEGGVVNKMGVWIVIRIWEGGIDFSHFSF